MTDFTRIQLRRDTAANWTTNNPTLALGEMGIETDTKKFKFGDGENSWNDLEYASNGISSASKVSDGKITLPVGYELPYEIIRENGKYYPNIIPETLNINPTTVYITGGVSSLQFQDLVITTMLNSGVGTGVPSGKTDRYIKYIGSMTTRATTATKNAGTSTGTGFLSSYDGGIDMVAGNTYKVSISGDYEFALVKYDKTTAIVDESPTWTITPAIFTTNSDTHQFIVTVRKKSDPTSDITTAEALSALKIQVSTVSAGNGLIESNPITLKEFRLNYDNNIYDSKNFELVFIDKLNLYSDKSDFDLINSTDDIENLTITSKHLISWIGIGEKPEWETTATPGIYKCKPLKMISDISDTVTTNSFGMPRVYKKLTTTVADCVATEGSFVYLNESILYVHPYVGDKIEDLVCCYGLDYASTNKEVISLQKSTAGNIIISNMGFLMDTINLRQCKSLDCTVWVKDCKFHRGSNDAFGINGSYKAYVIDCVADYPSKDCFNYHSGSIDSVAAEFNCIAYGAGQYKLDTVGHNTTTNSNNATTAHDGMTCLRFGGKYWDCEGAMMADVLNVKSLFMECSAKGVLSTISDQNYNAPLLLNRTSGTTALKRTDIHTNYVICCTGLDATHKWSINDMVVEFTNYITNMTSTYEVKAVINNVEKNY